MSNKKRKKEESILYKRSWLQHSGNRPKAGVQPGPAASSSQG